MVGCARAGSAPYLSYFTRFPVRCCANAPYGFLLPFLTPRNSSLVTGIKKPA